MILGTDKIEVVAWDLDETIFNQHIHNWLSNEIVSKKTTPQDALVHFIKTKLNLNLFNDPKQIAKTMLDIAMSNRKQAVVSFTDFPEIIRPALQFLFTNYFIEELFPEANLAQESNKDAHVQKANEECLAGLPTIEKDVKELVDSFFIMGGFPTKAGTPTVCAKTSQRNNAVGKAQHLQACMVFCQLDPKFTQKVLLIDDSIQNVYQAFQSGYHTIRATLQGEHFAKTRMLLSLPGYESDLETLRAQTPICKKPLYQPIKLGSSSEISPVFSNESSPVLNRCGSSKYSRYSPCLSMSEDSSSLGDVTTALLKTSKDSPMLLAYDRFTQKLNQLTLSDQAIESEDLHSSSPGITSRAHVQREKLIKSH